MPLTENPQILSTSHNLVNTLRGAFNTPNSYRPAHARGRLVKGTFTPTPQAASLSKAPHFNNNSSGTPVILRFSNSTGLPHIPDTDPNSNPRGLAIRFILGDNRRHTDIITHSTPFFPARTGEDFLALLQAIGSGTIGEFLEREENLAAKKFVTASKPFPESFVSAKYWGVNAYKFVNANGEEKFVRYRILPVEKEGHLSEEGIQDKGENYLFDELEERLGKHDMVSKLKLVVQIAHQGDVTNDATIHWPEEDREVVELGTIELESIVREEESLKEEQKIIFDPIPRVEGIELSEDPLLDLRAALYLISGRIRRTAAV